MSIQQNNPFQWNNPNSSATLPGSSGDVRSMINQLDEVLARYIGESYCGVSEIKDLTPMSFNMWYNSIQQQENPIYQITFHVMPVRAYEPYLMTMQALDNDIFNKKFEQAFLKVRKLFSIPIQLDVKTQDLGFNKSPHIIVTMKTHNIQQTIKDIKHLTDQEFHEVFEQEISSQDLV